MDYSILEKNICDMLQEMQLKLGYCREAVRLYYPLTSLNSFFKSDFNIEAMEKELKKFSDYIRDRMGNIEISHKDERFCIMLSATAAEYVHDNYPDNPFLKELISAISTHCQDIKIIIGIFEKYSSRVCIEQMSEDDFDYRIYFPEDKYVYYFKDEGCHISYHRFTRLDDPFA